MPSRRRRRFRLRGRRGAVVLVVVGVLYAAALYLFIRSTSVTDSKDSDRALPGGAASIGATPGAGFAEPTAPPSFGATTDIGGPSATVTRTGPGATITASEPGGITVIPPSGHKVVLTVTSAGSSIMRLGYLVPTSQEHPSGDMHDVRAPWSLTTVAYGGPGYAEVFLQTDATGVRLTCTITVDGKQTDRKSTTGPWDQAVCIG